MPDALSFVEIDGQHVELLPARTVLSLFSAHGGGRGGAGDVSVARVAAPMAAPVEPTTAEQSWSLQTII